MQPRQADAATEGDDGLSAFSMNIRARPLESEPNRETVCYSCGRLPGEKEPLSKCARCRGVFYCSRECQKKDWVDHKKFCKEPDKQGVFIVKCIGRMNQNSELMRSIGLALGEELFQTFNTASDNRKMWVASAGLYISPCEEKDFKSLISLDIPLNVLLEKPMEGQPKLIGFNDVSDKKNPTNDRHRVLWQKLRDDMDKTGCRDNTFVVLVQFGYNKSGVYFMPFVVHASDLTRIKMDQDSKRKSKDTLSKPFLFLANRLLGSLEDSKGRKMRCTLGDYDKNVLRDWAVNRARLISGGGNVE